jgi:hypothetical protein
MKLSSGVAVMALVTSCAAPPSGSVCMNGGTDGATARCLKTTQTSSYYASQSNLYFNALDSSANPKDIPSYSTLVARWEWPPWLKLTAFGDTMIVQIDQVLTEQAPSTVPTRDCRGFSVQPFGRCHVSFAFSGGPCPIYEEFTFNDQGQMTFIEAWSDTPALSPTSASDHWAEAADFHRLATKVPGLGNATGLINLQSSWMTKAAAQDPEIKDFVMRAENFWPTWTAQLQSAGSNLYPTGCGWAADAG